MKSFKKIMKSPFVTSLISWLAYWYVRFVAFTTRWDARHINVFYNTLKQNKGLIFVAWHGRIAVAPYFWNRTSKLSALVSPHRDGQLIAGLLRRFGIENINGSSNENARSAAVKLLRELKNDASIAIIPDGPRGPSMTMTMSPLYYAQKTGKPVIGMTYSIAHSKIIEKSWDRMLFPLPFQKGIVAITKPFFIPSNASPEDMERYRKQIESELNHLTWQIDRELNLPKIPQGTMPRNHKKTQTKGKG